LSTLCHSFFNEIQREWHAKSSGPVLIELVFAANAILFSMLTNDFWYGFLLGAGLVFLVFFVSRLIIRNRKEGR
jgi:hypothetical protein